METIERFLNTRGFAATRTIALTDTPCFTGRIDIETWKLELELRFLEGKFNYPHAYLPEWPHNPKMRAAFGFRHINHEGKICFVDESRTWWDSSMAAELVAGALERIEKLLQDNFAGIASDVVIARDFAGYWSSNKTLHVAGLVQNGQQLLQIKEHGSQRQWLIPNDGNKSWIKKDPDASLGTTWVGLRLSLPATKFDTDAWPPKRLNQLLSWMNKNSQSSVTNLVRLIRNAIIPKGKKRQSGYSTRVGVVLIWPNQNNIETLGCGFSFDIPEVIAQEIGHGRLGKAERMLKADRNEIIRYSLNRADPSYIQTRNTPNTDPSLKNKRVILVGAGTIGGHLAKLLCAHGAGWGPHGKLHIVDPDTFSIENVGRHLLGVGELDENKALALANHLHRDFPYLNIQHHGKSLSNCWDLISENSVVIDATGSQTVSIAIPDYLSKNDLNPVVLHSWVHAHGAATVAFLNDRKKHGSACFRCLWRLVNNKYEPRYILSKNSEQDSPVFGSCHHSYHAYASTVSMIAATQAMTLLYDYLSDKVTNTLNFNIIKSDVCQNRPSLSPKVASECPICNR